MRIMAELLLALGAGWCGAYVTTATVVAAVEYIIRKNEK